MTRRKRDEDVDELIRQYADADRSDTFVSYNDAIVLAKEVRKLRRFIRQVVVRTKHGPDGTGERGPCSPECVKCGAEKIVGKPPWQSET